MEPNNDLIICRCEEVSLNRLTSALAQAPSELDLQGLKLRTRAGMGICQGRTCGPLLATLLTDSGFEPGPPLKPNAPVRPLLLSDLAARASNTGTVTT